MAQRRVSVGGRQPFSQRILLTSLNSLRSVNYGIVYSSNGNFVLDVFKFHGRVNINAILCDDFIQIQ